MQENPEQFFNFGFTYNDFKSYLFKITYCRAIRKFVERKRLEKIAEFQRDNKFTFGYDPEEHEPNAWLFRPTDLIGTPSIPGHHYHLFTF